MTHWRDREISDLEIEIRKLKQMPPEQVVPSYFNWIPPEQTTVAEKMEQLRDRMASFKYQVHCDHLNQKDKNLAYGAHYQYCPVCSGYTPHFGGTNELWCSVMVCRTTHPRIIPKKFTKLAYEE